MRIEEWNVKGEKFFENGFSCAKKKKKKRVKIPLVATTQQTEKCKKLSKLNPDPDPEKT